MKLAPLFLLFAGALGAQNITLITGTPGNLGSPLGQTYMFNNGNAIPAYQNSALTVTMENNNSTGSITLISISIAQDPANTSAANVPTNFVLSGVPGSDTLLTLPTPFTVAFAPLTAGQYSAVLEVTYTYTQGASATTTTTSCTLSGGALSAQYTISYTLNGNTSQLQDQSILNFGNVSTSSSVTATFTLTSYTNKSVPLAVSIPIDGEDTNIAFSVSAQSITIPPNGTTQFTVTFAPGTVGPISAGLFLDIGPNSYQLAGFGVVVQPIDALQISYVDSTGVSLPAQAATPISFGQPVEGSSAALTFTVTNPITSFNAVSLSSISVTGAGFTATGLPPVQDAIQPGTSISFTVTFTPPQSGTFTGSLSIGTRPPFGLTGVGADLPIPTASLVFDTTNFTSQQQPHISVQFASPSTITAIGTLTMQFTSAVNGVQDDPAVEFLATSGRSLQVTVAVGATSATYSGQSELTFQTGTTAGTILFTLTFPNSQPITQQITIVPALVQITQMTAVAQDPFLVVTLTGYDNTYSTGPMTFNFYDTTGKVIASNMAVNATPNFQQYFSTTTSGGAFAIQLSFPTSGGAISSVGSVSATMSNSVGTSSLAQANF